MTYQIVERVTGGFYASDGDRSTRVARHRPKVSVGQCRMIVRRELSEHSVAVPVFVFADRELLGPRFIIRPMREPNFNFVGREIVNTEHGLSSRCKRGYGRVESAGPCLVILQQPEGCEFFEPSPLQTNYIGWCWACRASRVGCRTMRGCGKSAQALVAWMGSPQ